MKKLFLLCAVALAGFVNAQMMGNTQKGNMIIEINTGSWATGNTALSIMSNDGDTQYSIGLDGGYFLNDNLAVKAGLGYSGQSFDKGDDFSYFSYKLGVQYYVNGQFPVQVDFTGVSGDLDGMWAGAEGGYAWFVSPNVAVTPKVRYNFTLDEEKADSGFQGLIGFSLFL